MASIDTGKIFEEIFKDFGLTDEFLNEHSLTSELFEKQCVTEKTLREHGLPDDFFEKYGSVLSELKELGSILEECGPDRCGNCHTPLEPDDRYCGICGTKVGDGAYEPFADMIEIIYGPRPVKRTHICSSCGYTWKTCLMIDRQKYCPKCGKKE